MKEIFKILNFQILTTVNKTRKIWVYKNYEISLDSVRVLGDFVEIEYIGQNKKNPKKIMTGMISFLKKLDCGKIEENYVGYPYLLLDKMRLLDKNK